MRHQYILLDRDGTLNVDVHYLSKPADLRLEHNVIPGLSKLAQAGFRFIVLTNQSGLARGLITQSALEGIHNAIDTLLESFQIKIDRYFVCPHHPDDDCICRKPKTGLAQQAQEAFDIDFSSAWMIGDKACDINLGKNITARTVLVRTGYGQKTEAEALCQPNAICDTLLEAADYILRHSTKP